MLDLLTQSLERTVVGHLVRRDGIAAPHIVRIDAELGRDGVVPVRENEPARPSLVREIEAAVVVAERFSIEKIDALVAEVAAGVIEHDVEHHRQAFEVEDVDDAFQLIGAGAELIDRQRRGPAPREQRVRLLQVAAELAVAFDLVVRFRRIEVDAVVAEARRSRELLDRHELYGVQPEVAQIIDAIEQVEELANALALVTALRVDCVEHPDMQLVLDEIAKFWGAIARVVPGV